MLIFRVVFPSSTKKSIDTVYTVAQVRNQGETGELNNFPRSEFVENTLNQDKLDTLAHKI